MKRKISAKALCKAGVLSETLFWLEEKQGKFLGLDFDTQKS